MNNRTLISVAMLAALSVPALGNSASFPETWRCFDHTDYIRSEILNQGTAKVIFTLKHQGPSVLTNDASITVAGIEQPAHFRLAGIDRRWDFNPDNQGGFTHTFVIKPDGTGLSYDFSREDFAKPNGVYKCTSP